jgi:ABC-type branched-subunit amino acid transport system ATPase component
VSDVTGLTVEAVTVRFGGLVAVDGATLHAPRGRLTGLIGPNGAGKTTLFNVCSGLQAPTAGRILLDGSEVTRSSAARRARAGLGRTFQRMELYDDLSVRDNVAMGREAYLAGGGLTSQLLGGRGQRRIIDEATESALELCGLTALERRAAGDLSTGQRRLVELARVLAGPYTLLLLDEPSSGLDQRETARFDEVLRAAMQQRDLGILMVEHDMELVMGICDHLFVLEFGHIIFEGSPAEVRDSAKVRSAYLGAS